MYIFIYRYFTFVTDLFPKSIIVFLRLFSSCDPYSVLLFRKNAHVSFTILYLLALEPYYLSTKLACMPQNSFEDGNTEQVSRMYNFFAASQWPYKEIFNDINLKPPFFYIGSNEWTCYSSLSLLLDVIYWFLKTHSEQSFSPVKILMRDGGQIIDQLRL